jgi:hypothetical protein
MNQFEIVVQGKKVNSLKFQKFNTFSSMDDRLLLPGHCWLAVTQKWTVATESHTKKAAKLEE